jgi:kinesin family protein C2/C3
MPSLTPQVLAALKASLKNSVEAVATMKARYAAEFKLRRRYFNLVQELRGNIRVYCRVRPMLPGEVKDGKNRALTSPVDEPGTLHVENARMDKRETFEFEHVFKEQTTQATVYAEVADLVTSCLDGYNVCSKSKMQR